jgi:hypothetical protein
MYNEKLSSGRAWLYRICLEETKQDLFFKLYATQFGGSFPSDCYVKVHFPNISK